MIRPSSASRSPCSAEGAAVPDEGALEVEAAERRLPRVQVGEPGADVVASVPMVAPRARPARTAPRATTAGWRRASPRRRGPCRSVRGRRRDQPAADGHPGRLQRDDRGLALVAVPSELLDHGVGAAERDGPRRPIPDLRHDLDRLGPGGQDRAGLAAEVPSRASGHDPGAGRVLAQQRPGESVSSHWAWNERSRREPYAAAARSSALIASLGTTGRGEHLGPVLLAHRARDGRQRGQDVAGRVHRLQCADDVPGQQLGEAQVVLGLGALDASVPPDRTRHRPRSGRRWPPAGCPGAGAGCLG